MQLSIFMSSDKNLWTLVNWDGYIHAEIKCIVISCIVIVNNKLLWIISSIIFVIWITHLIGWNLCNLLSKRYSIKTYLLAAG